MAKKIVRKNAKTLTTQLYLFCKLRFSTLCMNPRKYALDIGTKKQVTEYLNKNPYILSYSDHQRFSSSYLIWNFKFLEHIWKARSSKTFELSLSVSPSGRQSVRPSVVITIASARKELRTSFIHWPVGIENGLYRSTGSCSSQTVIPGSWAHEKSNSH